MKTESEKKLIAAKWLKQTIHWDVDSDRLLWLRSSFASEMLFIRINPSFPDGPAYWLVLADGTEIEIDDFPKNWSRPPLKWPDSAKR